MSEWITDRLPTAADAKHQCVLITWQGGVWATPFTEVTSGQPWMPLPAPYIKQKRSTGQDGLEGYITDFSFDERVRTVLRHDEMVEALKEIIDWHHNPTKYPPYWVRTTFIDKCTKLVAKAERRGE